jgi:hypothetical protein
LSWLNHDFNIHDLWWIGQLLSHIGLYQFDKQSIASFCISNTNLQQALDQYRDGYAEIIETISYRLRIGGKIIKKEECSQWTVKAYVGFINSLIENYLGIKLKGNSSHKKSSQKYTMIDSFEPDMVFYETREQDHQCLI